MPNLSKRKLASKKHTHTQTVHSSLWIYCQTSKTRFSFNSFSSISKNLKNTKKAKNKFNLEYVLHFFVTITRISFLINIRFSLNRMNHLAYSTEREKKKESVCVCARGERERERQI